MTLNSFDRVADIYDETRAMTPEADSAIGRALAAEYRTVAAEPRVFELGIGTGRIAAPLAAEGIRVTGVDIAPKMLAILRTKPGEVDGLLAEATRLPFRRASFDGAVFVHILHLVPDPLGAAQAVTELIRPGGVLVHGETGYSPSKLNVLEPQLQAITLSVTGEPEPGRERNIRGRDAFLKAVTEAGATVEDRPFASWQTGLTPRQLLHEMRNKVHSGWWGIPDEAIPEIARRTEAFLLEQFDGDLDYYAANEATFTASIARRP